MANKNLFLQTPSAGDIQDIYSEGADSISRLSLPSFPSPHTAPAKTSTPAPSGSAALPTSEDIVRRATELGIDPAVPLAIWGIESGSNFNSRDSYKGAVGGMQVMPGTFRQMMGTDEGQRDPWQNMEAGLRYIAYGQKVLGTKDPALLAAGYHAGYGRSELKRGEIPNTSDGLMNTRDYAAKVAGKVGLGSDPTAIQSSLDAEEPGRYQVLTPEEATRFELQSKLDAEEPGRYQVLTADDLAKMGSGTLGQMPEDGDTDAALGETGFWDRLPQVAKTGWDNMTRSLDVSRAVLSDDFSPQTIDLIAGNIEQQIKQAQAEKGRQHPSEREVKDAIERFGKTEGFVDSTGEFFSMLGTAFANPKGVAIGSVEQLANMLPSVGGALGGAGAGAGVGAAAGSVVPGAGTAAGAAVGALWGSRAGLAAGTAALEYGNEISEAITSRLEDQGKQPTRENIAALLADPEMQSEIKTQAAKKGLTLAAVDALTLGIAGKVGSKALKQTSKAKKAGYGAGAFGIELAGEPVGEAASQLVARGEIDKGDVAGELIFGAGTAAGSAAIGTGTQFARDQFRGGIGQQPGQEPPAAAQPPAQPAPQPEPSGPITRAMQKATGGQPEQAAQPAGEEVVSTAPGMEVRYPDQADAQRVRVVAENGDAIEGVAQEPGPDGITRVLGDDGQIYVIEPESGVTIEPIAEQPQQPVAQETANDGQPTVDNLSVPDDSTPGSQDIAQPGTDQPAGGALPEAPVSGSGAERSGAVLDAATVGENTTGAGPAADGQPALTGQQPIVRTDGTPFKSESAARQAMKNRRMQGYEPVQVGEGWGLSPAAEQAKQAQPQAAPTEDERLAGKRGLYKAIKDTGAPDDVAANSVVNAQNKANELGTPVSVWRHREKGTIGIVPEGQKSPLKNAELVATIYPDAPAASEVPVSQQAAPANDLRAIIDETRSKRESIVSDVRKIVDEGQQLPVLKGKELTYVVHPSTKKPGSYQVTTYNDTGALGDTTVDNLDDIVSAIGSPNVRVLDQTEAEAALAKVAAAEGEYQSKRNAPKAKPAATSTVREMTEEGRAKDGGPIMPGDKFRTLSGRETAPYPKQKGEKYASQWLIDNATAEAESRGDDFNARTFRSTSVQKGGGLTAADRESMLMYLFGEQPQVVPSILKPLVREQQPAAERPATQQATEQAPSGDLLGGITEREAQSEEDRIANMRKQLASVEDRIVGQAGLAPGFIEEAMRSRKIPKAMKDEAKRLRQEIRDAQQRLADTPKAEQAADQTTVKSEGKDNTGAAEETQADNQQPVKNESGKPARKSNNKVFTDEAAEKARALLRSKLSQLNSGIDPEVLQAGITLAGWHIENGARTFAAYAKAMINDMGEGVKPYLKSWYLGVKFDPRSAGMEGMSTAAEVEQANVDSLADDGADTGETDTVVTPNGIELEIRYRVVEASDLITSNFDDGRENPDYPKELQPRERERAASQGQIREIVARFDPRRLGSNATTTDGAPIVSRDGVVESGNGRTIAIRRIYSQGLPAANAYRKWLADQGYDISGMTEPVLVRERITEMSNQELQDYTSDSNESTTLAMSPTERAMSDAKKIAGIIGLYRGGDVPSAANRDFVRAFMGAVVSPTARGSMMDSDGILSQDGRRRIEAALLAAAYGNADIVTDLFESSDSDIKAIGGALMDVAGVWAQMREEAASGAISASVDVTPNLMEAVAVVRRARGEGRPVTEFVKQDDFFAGSMDTVTVDFLSVFYRGDNFTRARGRDKVAEALGNYVGQARATQPGNNLFGEPEITGAEIIRNTNERTRQQEGQAQEQQDIFAGPRNDDADVGEASGVGQRPRATATDEAPPQAGGSVNAPSTNQRLERDSEGDQATQPVVSDANDDATRRNAQSTGRASQGADEQQGTGQRDQRLSGDGTTSRGKRGDQPVHRDDGQFRPESSATGSAERAGSRSDSVEGSAIEQERTDAVIDDAQALGADDLTERLAAQKKASDVKTKWGDKASIDAALPLLLPEQRDDVLKAEKRLANNNGILFTNGTGTGKTATGLGVIKRHVNDGKDNIIVVVPSDKIASDWVKFAGMMGVDLKQLEDTTSNGKVGPVITTYANFGQNETLVQRDWDLVVADESHYLSSNEDGKDTAALGQLRALTGHHNGFFNWVHQRFPKEWKAYSDAMRARSQANGNPDIGPDRYAALEQAEERAREKWAPIEERERAKWDARWASQKGLPKSVFLSATPFAYAKSTDYAEGYLFHYVEPSQLKGSEGRGGGYNSGTARDQFMMQQFGYRMRYNKLTAPEAGVDSQLMEQQFNEWLKSTGALSGRRLEVPFDYDRKFILVDDAVGTKIDEGLKFLREAEDGKYRQVYDAVMSQFDYQRRMYLLESMKARAAVPIIREHLSRGRKVVVFHDFNKGGGFDPFQSALREIGDPDVKSLAREVLKMPMFKLDFSGLFSPIETMTQAFPDALFFNGTVPKAKRRANADLFNDDNSGRDLIVVQSDAGREGVSLHDTTGKHQRVEINLGMPGKPVAAIQIEGRIYRTGQASDAVFRYLTTGTAWEASAFASKIAERASTAENLALGNEARGLRDAFIDAYQGADTFPASDDDGKGGKDYDRKLSAAMSASPFERSKTFYWAQQKNTKRRGQREGVDYFATPEPVGFKMVEWANIQPNDRALEPSAGHGAIARFFPEQSDVTMVEPSYELSQRAALANGNARIVNDTFEQLHVNNKYDAIVMNPPYGNGGKTSTEHLAKAAKHLRNGGRIVALLPRGGQADKRLDAFLESEDAADLYTVARVNMPSVTFERAGTAVNTQILVLEKHSNPDDAAAINQRNVDLSNAETINELFDRLENVGLPPRQQTSAPEPKVEIVEHTTGKGKVLRGVIRTDLTKDEAQAIDRFTFRKKNAEGQTGWFIRAKHLDDGPKYSVAPQTDTAAFKRWFGDSKVVDADGKPLVVYHGTKGSFDTFDTGRQGASDFGASGRGFYFSQDPYTANVYATLSPGDGAPNIMPVYLSLQNPMELGALLPQDEAQSRLLTERAKSAGYDGIIARGADGTLDEIVVFNPEQIKSATGNIGTFDPENPDIRYSTSPMSKKQLRGSLTSGVVGPVVDQLIESGVVTLHKSVDTLPEGTGKVRGIQALTMPDGSIHMVADSLTPQNARAVLFHEMFHKGGERAIGSEQWSKLMNSLGSLYRQSERSTGKAREFFDRARIRTQAAKNQGAVSARMENEEFGAYAIEEYETKRETMPAAIRKWVSDFIGFIKAWALRKYGKQLGQVTPAQLSAIAKMALLDVAADRRGELFGPIGTLFSAASPVNSPAFRRWFGDSKVVDADGNPLVVYHGTSADFSQFSLGNFGKTDGGWAGQGFYFSPRTNEAGWYAKGDGANIMPVYVSIKNPLEWRIGTPEGRALNKEKNARGAAGFTEWVKSQGYDGIHMTSDDRGDGYQGEDQWIAFDPEQIKSATGNIGTFDPENADIRYSVKPSEHFDDLSDDQKSFLDKIGPERLPQRLSDRWRQLTENLGLRIRQAGVDRYAALLRNDKAVYGEDTLEGSIASSAWVLARMSHSAGGALTAMLNNGRIYLDPTEKIIDVREGTTGLRDVFNTIGSPQEIDRFMGWVAANRARKLSEEGRENLFTPEEIEASIKLSGGKMKDGRNRAIVYAKAWKDFQQFRDDVLAVAEQAGTISPEQRQLWSEEFYVPFYRVLDEEQGVGGPSSSSGLSRQQAYKRLKGGKQNLNDLLENTLLNYHHLLQTALKNQAARQAIDNAIALDIAEPTTESGRDKKMSTFVMVDGNKQWYNINDGLTFKALSALNNTGLNTPLMKAGRAFKRLFTNLTTVTPQFVIANTLRDSLSAMATSPTSGVPFKNAIKGAAVYGNAENRAKMVASGGSFSFGHVYGQSSDEIKASLKGTLREGRLLKNPALIPGALTGAWRKWNKVTDFAENINRAGIWERNLSKGKLKAAFEARDLMDFSAHGDALTVRILVDLVPFLNARIQGLDKLYRSGFKPGAKTLVGKGSKADKKAFARFGAVVGALSVLSMLLYLKNYDDEEYRKLEDWQRDTYWFFRIGENAFFIPKPFEVGAIATLAERALEQFTDATVAGKKFAERLGHMLTDTFSLDLPQIIKPVYELSANRNTFTGRPIEDMGMQRLSPSLRVRPNTSRLSEGASRAMEAVAGDAALSPVQIDHLVGAYLGQVGAGTMALTDTLWRRAMGEQLPARDWKEYQPMRRFYRDLGAPAPYTRYATDFYNALKEADKAYANVQHLIKYQEFEKAGELQQKEGDKLAIRPFLNRVQRDLSKINAEMRQVQIDKTMSGEEKRVQLERLRSLKNMITEEIGKTLEQERIRARDAQQERRP